MFDSFDGDTEDCSSDNVSHCDEEVISVMLLMLAELISMSDGIDGSDSDSEDTGIDNDSDNDEEGEKTEEDEDCRK